MPLISMSSVFGHEPSIHDLFREVFDDKAIAVSGPHGVGKRLFQEGPHETRRTEQEALEVQRKCGVLVAGCVRSTISEKTDNIWPNELSAQIGRYLLYEMTGLAVLDCKGDEMMNALQPDRFRSITSIWSCMSLPAYVRYHGFMSVQQIYDQILVENPEWRMLPRSAENEVPRFHCGNPECSFLQQEEVERAYEFSQRQFAGAQRARW